MKAESPKDDSPKRVRERHPGFVSQKSPTPCKGGTNPPQQLRYVPLGKFMFPNAKHTPAAFSERLSNFAVTLRIAREFGRPKYHAGFRCPPVARTAMPETAVHKNREPRRVENEIRLPR
jgi:hypothetical protein